MIWIIKNLGLSLVAASVIFSAACITIHLQKIEDKLDQALKMNMTFSNLTENLPTKQLQQMAKVIPQ